MTAAPLVNSRLQAMRPSQGKTELVMLAATPEDVCVEALHRQLTRRDLAEVLSEKQTSGVQR